jgi:glycosyltransferase involved in cell wall biosynthesis
MPTGYGNVTQAICSGLARLGHEVHVLGPLRHQVQSPRGIVLHARDDTDSLELLRGVRPSVAVLLGNIGWLPIYVKLAFLELAHKLKIPVAFYAPVDGNTSDGRLPIEWADLLQLVDHPVAMSRYGQAIMGASGINADYIPHGVDLKTFSPPWNRELAKARFGYQGKFVVLSDSRNQPRKLLPRLLEVFALFAGKHPNAILHLHTDLHDEILHTGAYSYNLIGDARKLGIAHRVYLTPGFAIDQGGMALAKIARLYRAADVHLLASGGEGFGLPTLQAAATGTVPMACAYSASLELSELHGECLPVSAWVETQVGIRRALIDIEHAARRLAAYYADPSLLRARSAASRRFAEQYPWGNIVLQWDQRLRSLVAAGVAVRQSPISLLPGSANFRDGTSTPHSRGMLWMSQYLRSELRIPSAPAGKPIGHVLLGIDDIGILFELRNIFPILHGWIIGGANARPPAALGLIHVDESNLGFQCQVLEWCSLVVNTSGTVSLNVLQRAACLGVPCIGTSRQKFQTEIWPELAAEDCDSSILAARKVLADPSVYASLAARRVPPTSSTSSTAVRTEVDTTPREVGVLTLAPGRCGGGKV